MSSIMIQSDYRLSKTLTLWVETELTSLLVKIPFYFMKLIANLACVADVLKPRLVTSAKQCRDPCSGPPTNSTNYRKCVSNFHSSWGQINNGSFNRPTMVPTQILVHRWGPKTKISALFRRQTEPEFSFVCGAGYITIIHRSGGEAAR